MTNYTAYSFGTGQRIPVAAVYATEVDSRPQIYDPAEALRTAYDNPVADFFKTLNDPLQVAYSSMTKGPKGIEIKVGFGGLYDHKTLEQTGFFN